MKWQIMNTPELKPRIEQNIKKLKGFLPYTTNIDFFLALIKEA